MTIEESLESMRKVLAEIRDHLFKIGDFQEAVKIKAEAPPKEEKPKRKRRTKAQIEEDKKKEEEASKEPGEQKITKDMVSGVMEEIVKLDGDKVDTALGLLKEYGKTPDGEPAKNMSALDPDNYGIIYAKAVEKRDQMIAAKEALA